MMALGLMRDPMIEKILVVGGGIGGLTAALSLSACGFQCEVFDQNPDLEEIGAGIQLSPNAMFVFDTLGLGDALAKVSFEPHSGVIRDYRTGKAETKIALKGFCKTRYGAQYMHIHRADLLDVLYRAAKKAAIQFQLGNRISTYQQTDSSITLTTDAGEQYQGDLLVGADGMHSAIRAHMHSNPAARWTKQVAWRGVVATDKLTEDLISPDANIWLGPGRHFVSYYLRQGRLVNFVAVEERDDWTKESWHIKDDMANVRQAFSGWDQPIERLLEACEECYLWGLFDREALPRWVDGRAVLLGDACHPMLPFMAQGAAMAIEDGFVLAQQLADKAENIQQALTDYELKRKPRTSMLQMLSFQNARLYHLRSPFSRMARKIMLNVSHLAPNARLARLDQIYSKNVTQES